MAQVWTIKKKIIVLVSMIVMLFGLNMYFNITGTNKK